ncbi:hypothetical protein TNCV_3610811 [Trichonephila clavipes]|nr:hypothetical protein TNCV_3610811 [Trichonephila clavipes]
MQSLKKRLPCIHQIQTSLTARLLNEILPNNEHFPPCPQVSTVSPWDCVFLKCTVKSFGLATPVLLTLSLHMVKVTDSWLVCREFEPGPAEDPPCRGGDAR